MILKPISCAVLALCGSVLPALSQEAGEAALPLPVNEVDAYEPSMSAKEAALANWALAVSGSRAGRVVGDKVVQSAQAGVDFDALTEQAKFAVKTTILRYSSAHWVFATTDGTVPADGAVLVAALLAAELTCETDGCAAETAQIKVAFSAASQELSQASLSVQGAAKTREALSERMLMADIMARIGDYLASQAWYSDLTYSDVGRDGEEIAARLVGALAIWNNLEPYVGLVDAEVDDAINTASDKLLRAMRRATRGVDVVDPTDDAMIALREAAQTLSTQFHRASALFVS